MASLHYVKLSKPKRSPVYDIYWQFASRRFDVFKRRLLNPSGPWTDDPVITNHRFTNVFRASDRVSQYLIKIQYENDRIDFKNIFFKTILFKIFNKIETYEYLLKVLGDVSYDSFSFEKYDKMLTHKLLEKHTIYSAAYIMPSAGKVFGHKFKHSNHLALILKMMKDELYKKIESSKSLNSIYQLLLEYPSLGEFLAFQYTIDLNYSSHIDFSEMDFVVAGPGARSGIMKCFVEMGDYSYEDIIKMMADDQEKECERLGLDGLTLWGRKLQLIDCQNLFCEVDKYLRAIYPHVESSTGRKRIKQKFTSSRGHLSFFFPPKWEINDKINLPSCQGIINEGIFS